MFASTHVLIFSWRMGENATSKCFRSYTGNWRINTFWVLAFPAGHVNGRGGPPLDNLDTSQIKADIIFVRINNIFGWSTGSLRYQVCLDILFTAFIISFVVHHYSFRFIYRPKTSQLQVGMHVEADCESYGPYNLRKNKEGLLFL